MSDQVCSMCKDPSTDKEVLPGEFKCDICRKILVLCEKQYIEEQAEAYMEKYRALRAKHVIDLSN